MKKNSSINQNHTCKVNIFFSDDEHEISSENIKNKKNNIYSDLFKDDKNVKKNLQIKILQM